MIIPLALIRAPLNVLVHCRVPPHVVGSMPAIRGQRAFAPPGPAGPWREHHPIWGGHGRTGYWRGRREEGTAACPPCRPPADCWPAPSIPGSTWPSPAWQLTPRLVCTAPPARVPCAPRPAPLLVCALRHGAERPAQTLSLAVRWDVHLLSFLLHMSPRPAISPCLVLSKGIFPRPRGWHRTCPIVSAHQPSAGAA